ncbi:hypothetical protein FOA52_003613 [Chlamydomonas sp. UWO 241]|nr:hypothetical protein FOA52_003613 [Chlamydomonas sp. UWO 241]
MLHRIPSQGLIGQKRSSFGSRRGTTQVFALQGNAAARAARRVVITGMGLVSPLGHEHGEFYDNLLEGKSGISMIEGFDTEGYTTRFAGEIKSLDVKGLVSKKMENRVDKLIKYILVSGKKALIDAGLPEGSDAVKAIDPARAGILIGTAMGGMKSFETAVSNLEKFGHRKMNPFCIPFSINNMGGAMLAMDTGFMGPNYSISTACASGNFCIANAADHIRNDEADMMLAGAGDAAIIPASIGGFIQVQALSKRNDEPTKASRPWDKNRDGFVMGEGCGVLVLEELSHARARGAHIYAEYVDSAYTCDAHHMTEPNPQGKGVILCIKNALKKAGLKPEDVSYVNAHATSTQAGDMAEYRALRSVFPHDDLRMNSTKSMIGHLLGGAGAVEAIACIKAIQTGWLHPSINVDDPEDGVDLNVIVAGKKQQQDVRVALSNSFGFGGHNSCIMFKPYKE